MQKTMLAMFLMTFGLNAWEINTHRAIDRAAILYSKNLQTFLSRSGLQNYRFSKNAIYFDNYKMTYLQYIREGEVNGISELKQSFSSPQGISAKPTELIEAGTILEDAQWHDARIRIDGRFNNHFYDPQNGGHALTYGYGKRVNAVTWATNGGSSYMGDRRNRYDFNDAYDYFYKGFTESDPAVRRKYQAKMLVAVGHLMHMVNDMKKEVCYVRMA